MTTAIVTRNPLISHCTVVAVTSMATARWGRAMETIVSFRIITNAVTTMTPMISIGPADRTDEGSVFPVAAELLVSDMFPLFPSCGVDGHPRPDRQPGAEGAPAHGCITRADCSPRRFGTATLHNTHRAGIGENKLQSLHIRVGVITADRRDEVWRPGRRRCRRVLGRGTHGKISRPIYAVGQMNRTDRPGTRSRAHLLSCVAGSRSMRAGRLVVG